MNQADIIFKENIKRILNEGCWDENPRPRYESDGEPAHSVYIPQVFEKYDLSKGELPLTTLRPISFKNGVNEIRWIYQDQTSSLSRLEGEYGIKWWREWEVGDTDSIGERYGATVKRYNLINRLLKNLIKDPYSRRHIISLWQEDDFSKTEGLLPCAFLIMLTVRKVNGIMFLDMTLIQRSSDYLVAGHINKMQYVALLMMIAKHCGYQVGVFSHFVQNLHVYSRHLEQARELIDRPSSNKLPILNLNVKDGTNFYDITYDDFELIDYEPIRPQLQFELGI